MKRSIVMIIVLLTWPVWAYAFEARVTRITDGDTITVIDKVKHKTKIRLYGIDAPEMDQRFGLEAKTFMTAMAYARTVEIEQVATGPYGRCVAIVKFANGWNAADTPSLNELLLMAGYAWVDPRYCKQDICAQWRSIERQARDLKNGLWTQDDPQPPWEWRKNSKGRIKKSCDNPEQEPVFRGNTRTLNYHRQNCKYYDCKHCTMAFSSSIDALLAGYHPCAICKPEEDLHDHNHETTTNPFRPARYRTLTDA